MTTQYIYDSERRTLNDFLGEFFEDFVEEGKRQGFSESDCEDLTDRMDQEDGTFHFTESEFNLVSSFVLSPNLSDALERKAEYYLSESELQDFKDKLLNS